MDVLRVSVVFAISDERAKTIAPALRTYLRECGFDGEWRVRRRFCEVRVIRELTQQEVIEMGGTLPSLIHTAQVVQRWRRRAQRPFGNQVTAGARWRVVRDPDEKETPEP